MARKKKPTTARTPLTNDEARFVQEFINNGRNATRAMQVVKPHLTYSSARVTASNALNKVNVKNAIEREKAKQFRLRGTNADRVLGEWECLAFSHIGEVIDVQTGQLLEDIPATAVRAIAQVESTPVKFGRRIYYKVKVRMHSKGEALDRISRHLGLYKELPPLEHVLALLPATVAAALRAELAKALPDDGHPSGGDPPDALPDWAVPVGDPEGAGGGDGHPGRPELPVPGDEVDPGPVAGGVPAVEVEADPDAVLPPGGEEREQRGPDAGPLFDDA